MSTIWERTDNDGHADFTIRQSVAGYYGDNPGPVEQQHIVEQDAAHGAGPYLTPDHADGDESQRFDVDELVQLPLDGKPIRVRSDVAPPFGEWVAVSG